MLVKTGYSATIAAPVNQDFPAISISDDRMAGGGILWDLTSRTQLSTEGVNLVEFDRAIGPSGLYDAVTGGLVSAFPASVLRYGIAFGAAYAYYVDAAGLHVLDSDGMVILDWPGNYGSASIFPAPAELLIAKGPEGDGVIERVSLVGAQTLTPTFSGSFSRWFGDGGHFITTAVTNQFWVYTSAGALVQTQFVPNIGYIGGRDGYFWVKVFNDLNIYQLGSSTPFWTSSEPGDSVIPTPSGMALFTPGAASFELVTVSGMNVQKTVQTHGLTNSSVVGADANGNWVVGNQAGVVFHRGTNADPNSEGFLGCGKVRGIAGSASGYAAIGTAMNQVLVFEVAPGGHTLIKSLDLVAWGDMELTEDGTKLLAQSEFASSAKLYDLATGSTLQTYGSLTMFDYADAGGTVATWFGQNSFVGAGTESNPYAYVQTSTGSEAFPCVSPAGNGDFVLPQNANNLASCTTTFYEGGVAGPTVSGCPMGWVAPDRVLIQTFYPLPPPYTLGWYGVQTASIYDTSGQLISASPFTVWSQNGQFPLSPTGLFCSSEIVDATRVYWRGLGRVIDWTTGTIVATLPGNTRVGTNVAQVVEAAPARITLSPF